MRRLVTARQGGENSDRIGGISQRVAPVPCRRHQRIATHPAGLTVAMQGCARRPNIGYNGALTLAGGGSGLTKT